MRYKIKESRFREMCWKGVEAEGCYGEGGLGTRYERRKREVRRSIQFFLISLRKSTVGS